MPNKRKTIGGLATILIAFASLQAQDTVLAGEPRVMLDYGTRAVTVRYDDLDLNRDPGVERLYARLTAAAKKVCGPYDVRRVRERQHSLRCYDAALSSAVAQVDNARLAQRAGLFDAKEPQPRIVAARDGQ